MTFVLLLDELQTHIRIQYKGIQYLKGNATLKIIVL